MVNAIEAVSFIISIFSLVVICYGSIITIISIIRNESGRFTGNFSLKKLNSVKSIFGYYLLCGLDFLIAADVIRTIVENTLNDLTILGLSVAIRTVLSFFLGREIKDDQEVREELKK